ncbi:LexA family protein [Azospirillum picis]|uniref:Transcriptional regulator with XRE-family HTH domain n=2 Tax=Azospirillum picis TaxID=488438 RepID=A0ABU0MEG7_9PROT|nr:XRE family transcriptional regulator [Azospirillum picis]MBP2297980.1 transcriptional regulator with XRE-family HTH domain [Azospirillum picis]MDQ0531818.1 transcriptional regulator with XRE-family HTH domain [Azospirillum picis]
MNPLAQRIKQLRKSRGLNQAEFAELLGVTQPTVSRWELGKSEPEFDQIVALADLAGETPQQFAFGQQVNEELTLQLVFVVGAVQAGHWVEAVEWNRDEWYSVSLPPHPQYPEIKRFGLEVRGPSMNRVFPEGSVVECIRFEDLGEEPQPNDYVVVERHRADGCIEATVKKLVVMDDEPWLVPESDHPAFQRPIKLRNGHEDDVETVVIAGLVIGSYRPFLRRR